MKVVFLVFIFALLPGVLMAQYPQEIKPGQSKVVSSGTDTLWVIKNKQLDNCLKAGEKLIICNEIKDTLNTIIIKKDQTISNLEQNVRDYKEGYDRYKVKWEEADKEIERLEIKLVKQKRRTMLVAIICSVGSAVLTGIIIK